MSFLVFNHVYNILDESHVEGMCEAFGLFNVVKI